MNVLQPLTITDAILVSSTVPENDYAVWSAVTAYSIGDRVIKTTGVHKIYEAVAAGTNHDPAIAANIGPWWIVVSATNRWRAFDQQIGAAVSQAASIKYVLAPTSIADRVAFFGLSASIISIVVKDATTATIFSTTITLVDRTDSVTWFSWLLDPIKNDTEALSVAIPGYVGNTIEITITDTGTVVVGQIVLGRTQSLGVPLVGTQIGFTDYSLIERDAFGNATITERSYADTVEFQFTFPTEDARRVKRVIANLRAVPAVYFTGETDTDLGTLVYGIHKGFLVPLQTTAVFASLQVEGLA
jgi:hypothetical protein